MSSRPVSHPWILTSSVEELLERLAEPVAQPGSPVHEAVVAALQVRIAERIAEMQRETQRATAGDALKWAKVSGVTAAVATGISLFALLVAVL